MSQVESLTFQDRRIALHRAQKPSAETPTLLLLHGYGADEHDLIGLYPYLPQELDIICVRGKGSTPFGGAAWFDIYQSMDGSLSFNAEQALQAAEEINVLRRQMVAEELIKPGPLILGGFSQGSSISMLATVLDPQDVRALLIMSGRVTENLKDLISDPDSLKDLPVFIGHGSHDQVIPLDFGHQVRDLWANLPVISEYHEYPMAHQVAAEELTDINRWFGTFLQD